MTQTETFLVSDVFSPPERGKSRLTRTYIREHPGPFPVYSASTVGELGSIDTYDFDGEYLSWSTNGYAGRTMVISGKFSSTADRGLLRPKLAGLNLTYAKIMLEPLFIEAARGRRQDGAHRNEYTKLPPGEAVKVSFEIPVDEHGNLDEVAQADFVSRWRRIDALRNRAGELDSLIASAIVTPSLPDGVDSVDVSLTDPNAFTFIRKETGWFKKQWHPLNTGDPFDIPVYSAAKNPVAYVRVDHPKLIEASAESPVLSFAVDGDGSAGTNFVIHDRPFYITNKRASLRPATALIDLGFVYFSLRTMKADHGFGYNYKAYQSRLNDVMITLPIDRNGEYDLKVQQEVVRRLAALDRLRRGASDALRSIEGAVVTLTSR